MKHILKLLFFLNTTLFWSQSPETKYTIKWYNSEDGLKQNSIRYCVLDDFGFLWIGTELGLFRYDGLTFEEIKDKRYPNLSNQRIVRLSKDIFSKKIYLMTNPENCLYAIDNNKIEKIKTEHPEETLFTFNQYCYRDNILLKEIFKKNLKIKQYLKEYYEYGFVKACLTRNYLYIYQNKNIVAYNKSLNPNVINLNLSLNTLLLQFNESILVIDKGKVTLIKKGKKINQKINFDITFKKFLTKSLPNNFINEVFGSQGNYYLKFEGRIFQINFSNNKIQTKYLFDSPSEDVSCITFLQKEKKFLIGTRTKGIAILSPKLFNTIFLDEKKTHNSINYCYSTINISDTIWQSASGWKYNLKNGKIVYDDYLIDNKNSRFILPYKNKFYVQSNFGLWNIENHKMDFDFKYPKFYKYSIGGFSGYTYYKGKLYIAHSDKLFYLNKKKLYTDEFLNEKIEGKTINNIYSTNNTIYILTTKGVFKYIPELKKFNIINELKNTNGRYIKQINKYSYWLGCYGNGLYLITKNNVFRVNDENLDLRTAHALEEDTDGNLWISTNDGLLQINKKIAIQKILKKQTINCYKFSTEDGLLTNEFNGGGTHPSLQTSKGIIGFTSMKGFVWFQPKQIKKQSFKGNIIINSFKINNEIIVEQENNQYKIKKETKLIDIKISYGYYFKRDNITVAYRFEDETNWIKIKNNSFQIPRYKKGLHKLIIKISTHGFTDKDAVTKSFNLNFQPRYYELGWFWILILFIFILILFFTYKIGIYFSKKREKNLKMRIKEQTIELQQTISDLEISKESLDKSLIVKNILLKEIHHRVKNNLQLVMSILNIQASEKEKTTIERFIEKGQSRIASMVLIHENLYQKEDVGNINFETYTYSLVKNIRIAFGEVSNRIAVKIKINDIFFDIQTSIPLGLIINELVTNSFKHGFPNKKSGQISISIELISNTNYKLRIEDTGIGFLKDKDEKKSIGLELVSLLVQQLNGKITISTKKSTVFEILFSIN